MAESGSGNDGQVSPELAKEFIAADQDLMWLAEHGYLGGVAEIIRERRRQIEVLHFDAMHDDSFHAGGGLSLMVAQQVLTSKTREYQGTDGWAEAEEAMRKAGALAAAEIDRIERLVHAPSVRIEAKRP